MNQCSQGDYITERKIMKYLFLLKQKYNEIEFVFESLEEGYVFVKEAMEHGEDLNVFISVKGDKENEVVSD